MDTLRDFFHMGGYAFYVWTSYAIVALALVVNLWLPVARGKRLRRQLRRMHGKTAATDDGP